MEKVRVLVVEDEVIIAQSIISMIEKMGYECVGTAIRATKALELARQMKPDIALLDVNLKGEETGIWLADKLKKELNIPYIFLTSLGDKKTIEEAKSTMPYGYLLKPVEAQNIFASIEMALAKFSELEKSSSQEITTNNPDSQAKEENNSSLRIKDLLFVKDEFQYVKIMLTDIDYIKSDGNYVEIYCNGRKKVIKETLKNILSKMDDTFFQVHRSYVVNIRKIEKIGGNYLMLDQSKIPLVKQKRDELLLVLNALL